MILHTVKASPEAHDVQLILNWSLFVEHQIDSTSQQILPMYLLMLQIMSLYYLILLKSSGSFIQRHFKLASCPYAPLDEVLRCSTFPIKIKTLHSILLPRSLNSLSILHSQCTFLTPKGAFLFWLLNFSTSEIIRWFNMSSLKSTMPTRCYSRFSTKIIFALSVFSIHFVCCIAFDLD